MPEETVDPVELATELTIAWLGNQNNRVAADEVPAFLRSMHTTILELGAEPVALSGSDDEVADEKIYEPAVTARKSLASKDFIISMIDGKPYRTLRRHIATHGMTDAEYRKRYNLRADYPMVAESYSLARREMAHKIGLGRKNKGDAAATDASATPAADAAPMSEPTAPADETAAPARAKRTRRKTTDAA